MHTAKTRRRAQLLAGALKVDVLAEVHADAVRGVDVRDVADVRCRSGEGERSKQQSRCSEEGEHNGVSGVVRSSGDKRGAARVVGVMND